MPPTIKVSAQALSNFIDSIFCRHQVHADAAQAWTHHLVEANLWGMDSHGVQQLIGYDRSLTSGRINPNPQIQVISERLNLIHLDAERAPGQYASRVAMERAIAEARHTGISMVGVTNSNHFGMAGYYTHQAASAGMIGFATTDTNVVDLAPFGGREAKLGNNAWSWGIPNGDRPIILDMATGAVSGGKIKHFAYQNLQIPLGWGLSSQGHPTNDPTQVAVNLPASYKGAGLALISDLLCGPLLGTAAAMFKNKSIHDAANGTCHLFMVFDVAAWTDPVQFEQEVQRAIAAFKSTPCLDPTQAILYPGERESTEREHRLQAGIPLPQLLVEDMTHHFGTAQMSMLLA